jgi:hypothetical protein
MLASGVGIGSWLHLFIEDVVLVEENNILKLLQKGYFNYVVITKIVNIARFYNFYYVINGTCDHSQIETELLEVPLSQVMFSFGYL